VVAPPRRVRPGLIVVSPRASERQFHVVAALVFLASAAATVTWGASMTAMGGMAMPGGWTMSMAWMRVPGQSWTGAATSFLGMWVVMMPAMMLPALVPMLRRYRRALGVIAGGDLGRLTVVAGLGYFAVWTALGLALFPPGAALAELAMRQPALARAVPKATGVVVLLAGALQFTSWKARHLASCVEPPGRDSQVRADTSAAWRHGLCLGLHCSQACAGLTAVLLVVGVMDVRAMALVAAAITAERVAADRVGTAHAIGAVVVIAGCLQLAGAATLR
jgi:predicted metal-binding membrane protein